MGMGLSFDGAAFRRKMQSRAANLKAGAQLRIVRYATTILVNLDNATPILTGKARAEWQIGLGSEPAGELLGPTAPPMSVDWQSYRDAALLTLAGYTSGQTIYIVNNASYIGALNAGASPQAPADFVQEAVDAATEALRATL